MSKEEIPPIESGAMDADELKLAKPESVVAGSVVPAADRVKSDHDQSEGGRDAAWAEFGELVDQDDLVVAKRLPEGAIMVWGGKGGQFTVHGSATRLGLTLAAMLAALGLIIVKGNPVVDAYVPMAGLGGVSLLSAYWEKPGVGDRRGHGK
jgi:hypothetical protein